MDGQRRALAGRSAGTAFDEVPGWARIFRGRDNYYNHSIYRTGWSYGGMSIGTPLFINQARAAAYGHKPGTDQHIVSNRVLAGHFGFKGEISPRIGCGHWPPTRGITATTTIRPLLRPPKPRSTSSRSFR
jgi:hypothetical protein